jgi:PAS domain S-box-containing protein
MGNKNEKTAQPTSDCEPFSQRLKQPALKLSLLYLLVGLGWIFGTDYLVSLLPHAYPALEVSKGVLFIVVTAGLFYVALTRNAMLERTLLRRHYDYLAVYAKDLYVLADAGYHIVEANQRAVEVFGYSLDELIGMNVRNLRAEDHRDTLVSDLSQVTEAGRVFETIARRKDGSNFPVEIAARLIDVGGRRFFQGIIRDISERKHHEAVIASSRDRLLALLDGMPDAAWLKDIDERYLAVNKTFARGLGKAVHDIVGLKNEDGLFSADTACRFSTNDREVMRTGRQIIFEAPSPFPDGLSRWEEVVISPIYSTDGKVTGTVVLARDITERKASESRLLAQEANYRALAENVPDIIFRVDSATRVLYVNSNIHAVLGKTAGEIIGKDITEIGFPEPLHTMWMQSVAEVFATGKGKTTDREIVSIIGLRRFEIRAIPELDAHGKVDTILGIARDVTELRQHEVQLATMNRALQVLSEANSALVRATGEPELLDAICRVLTSTGNYRLAWVGYVRPGGLEPMSIRVRASDPLEGTVWGTLTRTSQPDLPAWQAIDQGVIQVMSGTQFEKQALAWREKVLSLGIQGVLQLPLKQDNQVFGLLVICTGAAEAFSGDEVRLMEELASDLAFGILGLRARKARDDAMQALNESESKLRTIIETTSDGIVMVNDAGIILFANPGAERLLARQGGSLIGTRLGFSPDSAAQHDLNLSDGSHITIELTVAQTTLDNAPTRIVALHDVTSRRQMESQRQQHALQLQHALIQTIEAMALTVEKRDPYTAGHEARVAELAVAIGQEMQLSQAQLEGIRLGAMIHDLGKIYIPAEILNRPGKLSTMEKGLIKTHPEVGYDIVRNIDFIWPVKEMVLQHHERMDGSGYPSGLKGEQIVLEARIIAVADVVEAMSSHRPYRPALGVMHALDEIRSGSGTHYDPAVANACLRLFEKTAFAFRFDEGGGQAP